MRIRTALIAFIALASVADCGGSGSSGSDPYGGGTVGGQGPGGGGPVGAVTLGSGIQFVSSHNASENPAVGTIAVGGSVTWTWTGSLPHSVRSIGSTSFASSNVKTASGTYAVQFTTPGTYQYDCAIHGMAMTGTILVQ